MTTTILRRGGIILAGLLLITRLVPVAAAVPNPTEPVKSESPAEKIRKALDQTMSVDLQGHTLTAAIEVLRHQSKVNIVLDAAAILQTGLAPDEVPVNLKLDKVRLRTVLKALLSQFGLTWVIDEDILLLTTEETAIHRQVRQRVDVNADQVPLEKALQQLARQTATNLVIDPRQAAKGKEPVTLRLDDVPLEVAVRLLAELAGLRSVRQANVLFVTSKEVAAALRKEEDATQNLNPHGLIIDGGLGGAFPGFPPPPPANLPALDPAPVKPADPR
jgi:hypothetical protein